MAVLEGPAVADRAGPDRERVLRDLAAAGPNAADVLRALVRGAGSVLDAPARLAMLRSGRLEWVLVQGTAAPVAGSPVSTHGSPCGDAWRDGVPRLLGEAARPAPCLGSPPAALVVPVVLEPAGGRRAAARPEVCALLALTGSRAGWFDAADLAICAELAGVAAQRLALLVARRPPEVEAEPEPEPQAEPERIPRPGFGGWFGSQPPAGAPPSRSVPQLLPPPRDLRPAAEPITPAAITPPGQPITSPAAPVTAVPPALPAADSLGLWQWDAATGECGWSTPVARLLGLPLQTALSMEHVREVVAAVDLPRFDVAVRAVASGRGVAGAIRLHTRDGRTRHVYAWSEVRRAEDGMLLGAWGGVVDVSAFERDAAQQRDAVAGLRAAQELAGLATWQWVPGPDRLLWSAEMFRLVGVDQRDGEPSLAEWHALVHPDDLPRARRLDAEADLEDGAERVETFRLRSPDGSYRHVQAWACGGPPGPGGRTERVLGAAIDVTRQLQDRVAVQRLATADPLTGLTNRAALLTRLDDAQHPGAPCTLLVLGLDRFRAVNDGLGHQVGDELLVEVARRLGGVVPPGCTLARTGGDEFAVLAPAATEADAVQLAEGLLDALRRPCAVRGTGELVPCHASLGLARSDGRGSHGRDLLREADAALRRAKEAGGDRVVLFDVALREATRARIRAELHVRRALESGGLSMLYQPVVDFVHGRVVGASAVVRLQGPGSDDGRAPGDGSMSDGSMSPDMTSEMLVDVAHRTGLVGELDAWAVEQAIAQLASWADGPNPRDPAPWLSVSISVDSLEHPAVTRRLLSAVQHSEVPRDRLRVAVSGHEAAGGRPGVEAALRQLAASGVCVGIDGFGTGPAALSWVQQLQPAFVTVQPGYVATVGESDRGDAVVAAAVLLARAHGMQVLAAGVETGRQARRLRELGCDLALGQHFGRPGEAARIVRS